MKKVLALTAGVLVALAPTGTAFAAESTTVPGKAYGNCKHSSAGGDHDPLLPEVGHGNGNGGLVQLGKAGGCATTSSTSTSTSISTTTTTTYSGPSYDDGPR